MPYFVLMSSFGAAAAALARIMWRVRIMGLVVMMVLMGVGALGISSSSDQNLAAVARAVSDDNDNRLIRRKCEWEGIFNFGDSNSDTGGFYAAFPAQSPPFGMTFFHRPSGRASDGRLLIDFLAEALSLPFLSPYLQSIGSNFKHGANFATLASTVLLPKTSLFVSGLSPFSLGVQLSQLKELKAKVVEYHSNGSVPGYLPSLDIFERSLYTFDIGQNDFTSNLATLGIAGVEDYLPEVVSEIVETIKEIYAEGGRTFLVFNLAPVGCFPAFLTELPHNASDIDQYGCMISYNSAVLDYNSMLKEKLHHTRQLLSNANVIYVDTHSVKLELFRHPTRHGLLHGTRACCGHGGGAYNFNPQVFCGNSKIINGTMLKALACSDPERYVSWDGIHATEKANRLITLAMLNGSFFYPAFPISKLCKLRSL